jgi:hypothetical protein
LDRAKKGCKNQVWACFDHLWGPCDGWPNISGNDAWIDSNYNIRNDIAHGGSAVDIGRIAEIAPQVPLIHCVAHRFLIDSRNRLLSLDRNPPQEFVPEDQYNPI